MNDTQETAVAVIEPSSQIVAKEGGNVALTALLPEDMQKCQQELIGWCENKIKEVRSDAKELRGAVKHAHAQKWKTSTLVRHAGLAEKRVVFYEKMKAALEAGFVIIPNFPVTLFAIRTDREKPLRLVSTQRWGAAAHRQKADVLSPAEGEYQNPQPLVGAQSGIASPAQNEPNRTVTRSWAEDWAEMDFPVNMAKPEIMEATTNAMAMKVFDQFGILPSPYRKVDPIIVAQLIDPRGYKDSRVVTFMVAWHLDTRSL